MPRQNRVTPRGEIIAASARGTWMGNRGNLHDASGTIRRNWRLKAWITCRLDFKGRQREVMSPGKYTELFFVDEATALAAGHRPCAECRRFDYNRFKSLWLQCNGNSVRTETREPSIKVIDSIIHSHRINSDGSKLTFFEDITKIPDGVMIQISGRSAALLVWHGKLLIWSPSGYVASFQREVPVHVEVLTPLSIYNCIVAGYAPQVDASAG